MDALIIGLWFVLCFPSAIAGGIIGAHREAFVLGAVVGFALGPLGVIVALAVDGRTKCPQCRERVYALARLCPHCHVKLTWSHSLPRLGDAPPLITPEPRRCNFCQREIAAGENYGTTRNGKTFCQRCAPRLAHVAAVPSPPPISTSRSSN